MIRLARADGDLFAGVFRGRRVLLTGDTGFKGSWTALWLERLGAKVVGYALDPPTTPSLFDLTGLADSITHVAGDVRDLAALRAVFAQHDPEIVLHMAAQSLVLASYREPALTYETNVMGTVNVLEAARQGASVKVVLNVTSDKCYENREWEYAYRENDPMGGFDPYSSSKGCSELVTAAYRSSFFDAGLGVSVASVRAGNVIGGGDWAPDRIIPDCARALGRGEPVQVRNPHAVRPWQHVLEPLSGYLWLASRLWNREGELTGAWNFGPGSAGNVAVGALVDAFVRSWGDGSWHAAEPTAANPHEATFLKLDSSKAEDVLGWRSVYDIDRAIAVTAAWYRAHYGGDGEAFDRTLADIEAYVDAARALCVPWAGGGTD